MNIKKNLMNLWCCGGVVSLFCLFKYLDKSNILRKFLWENESNVILTSGIVYLTIFLLIIITLLFLTFKPIKNND